VAPFRKFGHALVVYEKKTVLPFSQLACTVLSLIVDLFGKKDPSGHGRANFNVEEVFILLYLHAAYHLFVPQL